MNDLTVKILSKFTVEPCPSSVPLDFRSNPNIFSADTQLPDLYIKSKNPIDKNICFYKISYTPTLHENIFPKQKFNIPSIENPKIIKNIEKVNLDDIFGKVKLTSIDVFDKDFSLENIEESIMKSNLKKIIKENKTIPYESKSMKAKSQWYLIGVKAYGPYTDEDIFNFLNYFVKDHKLDEMKDKFMIWERSTDIFYTVDVCFEMMKQKHVEKMENEAKKNRIDLTGKNDFENLLLCIEKECEQGKNVGQREVDFHAKQYSKFNIMGFKLKNVMNVKDKDNNNKEGLNGVRSERRKMTYDQKLIHNALVNFKGWNESNDNTNVKNAYNPGSIFKNKQQSNINQHNQQLHFGRRKSGNNNMVRNMNVFRNNHRRYTVNPELSKQSQFMFEQEIIEEKNEHVDEKEIKDDLVKLFGKDKEEEKEEQKGKMKLIDITDSIFN